jgi:hypothetical protein
VHSRDIEDRIDQFFRAPQERYFMKSRADQTPRSPNFAVPWLMVRETPPFRPPKALLRTTPPAAGDITEQTSRLWFLNNTNQSFTPPEMIELKSAITSSDGGSMLQTPSRLALIRMNKVELSQEKIALDLDNSAAYYVPTEPVSRGFTIDETIISPRSDNTQDLLVRNEGRMTTSSLSDKQPFSPQQSDQKLSIEELRRQVWIYSHDVSGIHGAAKAVDFPFQIQDNESIPVLSRGRRRLLNAIGEASGTNNETLSVMMATESELLTETSYCARRLHDFMNKKFMDLPDFLEPKLLREKTAGGQRRSSTVSRS